jgi:DNA-binding transcriptional regulator YdaS (Cro superfamily)
MCANTLLDTVSSQMQCKNDAALSRLLEVAPPVVSNWRRGRIAFGPTHIVRLHEKDPEAFPVKRIRELLAA